MHSLEDQTYESLKELGLGYMEGVVVQFTPN
jgi:hypothetical protein